MTPASHLPRYGQAPDFTGTQRWFNTPGDKPLTLRALRGRVVLVDFWTYTCINCLRTLPYLEAWDARYRADGLTIVGVHSPEFPFEHDAGNVASAIKREGIRYPVAQDNDLKTWNAWGNEYWPAEYLIDAQGQVRHVNFGEGDYDGTEAAIRSLLVRPATPTPARWPRPRTSSTRRRARRPRPTSASRAPTASIRRQPRARAPTPSRARSRPATSPSRHLAASAPRRRPLSAARAIHASVVGKDVYLVLARPTAARARWRSSSTASRSRPTAKAPTSTAASSTSIASACTTSSPRPRVEHHALTLRFSPGVAGYAFTFG